MLKKLRTLPTSDRREMLFGKGGTGVIAQPKELSVSDPVGRKKKLVAVAPPNPERIEKFKQEVADLCHAMDRNWRMLASALIERGVPEINAEDLAKETCDRFRWLKLLCGWSLALLCLFFGAFILIMAVLTMTGIFGRYDVTSRAILDSLYSIPLGFYITALGLVIMGDVINRVHLRGDYPD